ncbi:putative MFS-type transporter C09D4.1 [Caerostris extrusa]|uniref:MFS-type transporter C09D4.1 n=1 Tax=Caerostris extrusa TaxID=172846 RepID=A0AAV4N3M4_CAEEX|nr:putative MFS-type transporter C09D4.1 [Caerostris extrusa]
MALLFIVAGLVGSMIFGHLLDCTQRFKETAFSVCVASFITCLVFSACLYLDHIWIQYLTIGIYGFFLTSFLPIGFEYGIEVTYPLPEVVCAILLSSSTMVGTKIKHDYFLHSIGN